MSDFSPIYLRGPFDAEDTINDTNGPRTYLWNVEEYRTDNSAELSQENIPTLGIEDTLLASFQSREDLSLNGTATGNRLSNFGFSSDSPRKALMEWIVRFESLCTELQGIGYLYSDEVVNRFFNPTDEDSDGGVLVETCSWTYEEGSPFAVDWNIDLFRGRGVMDSDTRNRNKYIENQQRDWIEDDGNKYQSAYDNPMLYEDGGNSYPLGNIEQQRVEINVDFDVFELVDSDSGENLIVPTSGAVARINIQGSVTRSEFNTRAALVEFCNRPQKIWVGENTEIILRDVFMDREYEGQLQDFNTTWSAEQNEVVDYNLELVTGSTL